MTRNQKIALGCGGAGCLGLIVVVIAGVLIYFFAYKTRSYSTNRNDDNFNFRTNRNSNSNDNSNANDNDNDNSSSSTNSSSTTASSMSSDDKHKLYQAAFQTGDAELIRRVSVKIGIMEEDFTPGANYQSFILEHVTWAARNTEFAQSINTPDKARAYVDQNFPN
jgi:cytoskeletal protein RodZ